MISQTSLAINAFSLSPNPNHLYVTPGLRSLLYQARGTIERRQGLVAILADVGMGKSTILRYLFSEYDAKPEILSTFIPTPKYNSFFALVKSICADFDIEAKRSLEAQQNRFHEFLVQQYNEGKNVVLFLDEAQMLKDDFLEGLRGFLNFETNTAKLVQIVLAGQLELKTRLDSERNKPIKSRIHSYALISPLTDREMREMIDYRCNLVEIQNPFDDAALSRIWDITKGVPRSVLKICDKAYDYMHIAESNHVSIEMIDAAAEDAAVTEVLYE